MEEKVKIMCQVEICSKEAIRRQFEVFGRFYVCLARRGSEEWSSRWMFFWFQGSDTSTYSSQASTACTLLHSKKKGDQEEGEQTKKPKKKGACIGTPRSSLPPSLHSVFLNIYI